MMNILSNYRKNIQANEEGFTLIELMITVVIIGILAAIAIPIFMNQQKGAIVAGIQSDVKSINTTIATLLIKSPTSVQITADSPAGDNGIQKGTVRASNGTSVHRFDITKTSTDTAIRIDGAWNAYYIFATNASVAPGNLNNTSTLNNAGIVLTDTTQAATVTGFGVIYSAKTGKTITTGD